MSSDLALTASVGPGPFYKHSIIHGGELANAVDPGSVGAVRIEGRVLDSNGVAVTAPDVLIELCATDQFARVMVDDDGAFAFVVRKPQALGASAPHFEVSMWVFPLAEPHLTRLYFPDEDANDSDPLLEHLDPADRETLFPTGTGTTLHWDLVLGGERQTAFLVPDQGPSLVDAGVATRPFQTLIEQ